MDSFDYVMHGKVFKFKDNSSSGQLKADVSAGARGGAALRPLRPLRPAVCSRTAGAGGQLQRAEPAPRGGCHCSTLACTHSPPHATLKHATHPTPGCRCT